MGVCWCAVRSPRADDVGSIFFHLTDELPPGAGVSRAEVQVRAVRSSLDSADPQFPSHWSLRGGGACVVTFGGHIYTLAFKGLQQPPAAQQQPGTQVLDLQTATSALTTAVVVRLIDSLTSRATLLHKTVALYPTDAPAPAPAPAPAAGSTALAVPFTILIPGYYKLLTGNSPWCMEEDKPVCTNLHPQILELFLFYVLYLWLIGGVCVHAQAPIFRFDCGRYSTFPAPLRKKTTASLPLTLHLPSAAAAASPTSYAPVFLRYKPGFDPLSTTIPVSGPSTSASASALPALPPPSPSGSTEQKQLLPPAPTTPLSPSAIELRPLPATAQPSASQALSSLDLSGRVVVAGGKALTPAQRVPLSPCELEDGSRWHLVFYQVCVSRWVWLEVIDVCWFDGSMIEC
jgi:hypothetical protein